MKLLPLLFLLAASTCADAQAPTPIAAAPSPARNTKRVDEAGLYTDPADPNSFRFTELMLGKGEIRTLGKVVEELSDQVRSVGGELLNVLFAPGAEQIAIPGFTLRNVTGSEALQMVAVSAECTLEGITSTESGRVIGWKIHAKTRQPTPGMSGLFGSGLAPTPAAPAAPPALPAPVADPALAVSGFGSVSPFGGGFRGFSGAMPGVDPGLAPQGVATTSVYSLGSLVDGGKADDLRSLEESLKMTLDSASLPEEKPKLSLHEKTRLLVVKGGPETHQLVGSFLEALTRNRTSERSGEAADARSEMMRIRESADMKINEAQRQMARMEKQIDNLEKERSELVRQNQELDAKLSRGSVPADTGKK